jgi:hypothetical protein
MQATDDEVHALCRCARVGLGSYRGMPACRGGGRESVGPFSRYQPDPGLVLGSIVLAVALVVLLALFQTCVP